MQLFIGVDLHKTQFTVCFLNGDRSIKVFSKYLTTEEGYYSFFTKVKEYEEHGYESIVAVESTGNTRFFRNQLLKNGIAVKIVNTAKFKVVTESVKKTDQHDAMTLAEFLEKDMLPEAVLCSEACEQIRRILKARTSVVKLIISLKNQIHGLLLSFGIITERSELQSEKGRQRILRGLEDQKNNGNAALTVKPLMDMINSACDDVKKLEGILQELVKEDEDVKLLKTIPGVGIITATTIKAFTDDINRYASPKKYAAHAGLVPWVQNSNNVVHHGHITKRGPVELRTAFVQAVMGMIRFKKATAQYRIVRKYQTMKSNKGAGKTIIATARKISTIVWTMLKKKQPFNPKAMMGNKEYWNIQAAVSDAALAG